MSEDKYKLTYFNSKGIAEGIRYIFAYAGVPFEDNRIKKADWPQLKNEQPYGTLPVLEVNGNQLTQSIAICRFLGKKFGLVPKDPLIEANLESIVDHIKDAITKMKKNMDLNTPEAQKDSEALFKYLLDRLEPLAELGYFHGTKPSWVDIYFTGIFDTMEDLKPNLLVDYPKLQELRNTIKSNDRIQYYIKHRPEPEPRT